MTTFVEFTYRVEYANVVLADIERRTRFTKTSIANWFDYTTRMIVYRNQFGCIRYASVYHIICNMLNEVD